MSPSEGRRSPLYFARTPVGFCHKALVAFATMSPTDPDFRDPIKYCLLSTQGLRLRS